MQTGGQGRPDDGRDPETVAIEPVTAGAGPAKVPRVLVVALIVGALAFIAGAQLGQAPTPVSPAPSGSPALPSAPSSVTSTSTGPPVPGGQVLSEFARTFAPEGTIAELRGSAGCTARVSSVPGFPSPRPSPTLVRAWMVWCPIRAASQAQFFTDLTIVLERQIPFGTMSSSGDGHGMTVAYYPYSTGPFAGHVTVAAAPAGPGLGIAITLEERRAP
jgi:hypothetical protein